MGMRKKERTWPKPTRTRHAWLVRPGHDEPPVQALVIAWEHRGGAWMAFIVWVSDSGQIIHEWVPADRLGPVPALERQMPGNPNYSRGW